MAFCVNYKRRSLSSALIGLGGICVLVGNLFWFLTGVFPYSWGLPPNWLPKAWQQQCQDKSFSHSSVLLDLLVGVLPAEKELFKSYSYNRSRHPNLNALVFRVPVYFKNESRLVHLFGDSIAVVNATHQKQYNRLTPLEIAIKTTQDIGDVDSFKGTEFVGFRRIAREYRIARTWASQDGARRSIRTGTEFPLCVYREPYVVDGWVSGNAHHNRIPNTGIRRYRTTNVVKDDFEAETASAIGVESQRSTDQGILRNIDIGSHFDTYPSAVSECKLPLLVSNRSKSGYSLNSGLFSDGLGLIRLILHPIRLLPGSFSLPPRSHSKRMGILSTRFHFRQLATHGAPLKNSYYYQAKGQQDNASRKADHQPLGTFHSILYGMYCFLHAVVGYALCWWAGWVIWRRWRVNRLNHWTLLYGALFYAFAGAIVWHGFIVTQKLLDTP